MTNEFSINPINSSDDSKHHDDDLLRDQILFMNVCRGCSNRPKCQCYGVNLRRREWLITSVMVSKRTLSVFAFGNNDC